MNDTISMPGRRWTLLPQCDIEIAVDVEHDVIVRVRRREPRKASSPTIPTGGTCERHGRWVGRHQMADPCWAHLWGSEAAGDAQNTPSVIAGASVPRTTRDAP